MRLPKFLPIRKKLSRAWTYKPGASIWRILPASDGYIVGESRDSEAKQVSFFCVELETGKPVWQGRTVGEEWWVGIEAIIEGVAFLHRFARPDMPEHAGLIAIDMSDGRDLWDQEHLQLKGIGAENVYVRDIRDPEGPPLILECRTGNTRRLADDTEEADEITGGFGDPPGIIYPAPLTPDGPEWSAVRTSLRGRHLVGACEAAKVDDRLIFSYHESAAPAGESSSYTHHITVVDGRGRQIYDDTLHERAHMPVYDAFFLKGAKLYYVRQEQELVAVDVSPAGT